MSHFRPPGGRLLAAKPAPGERPPAARALSSLDALAAPPGGGCCATAAAAGAPAGFEVSLMPGSTLELLLMHPSGAPPPLAICGLALGYPPAAAAATPPSTADGGWELVSAPEGGGGGGGAAALPGLAKLSQPLTQQAPPLPISPDLARPRLISPDLA